MDPTKKRLTCQTKIIQRSLMSKVAIFTKYKSERKTRWAIVFGQNVNWKRKQVLIKLQEKSLMLSYYVAFLVAVYHTYRVCFVTITA